MPFVSTREALFALGGGLVVSALVAISKASKKAKTHTQHGDEGATYRGQLLALPSPALIADLRNDSTLFVHLGSSSPTKAKAVQEAMALAHGLPLERVLVHLHAAASEIAEQPVGDDETMKGALNRLSNALAHMTAEEMRTAHYVLAIENGISKTSVSKDRGLLDASDDESDNVVWHDKAAVVIQNKSGQRSTAWSAGLRVPGQIVAETRRQGFHETDIGAVGLAMMPEIGNAKDPHSYLTRGVLAREKILNQAIVAALTQFPRA